MEKNEYRSMSLVARRMAEEWLAKPDHEAAMAKTLEYMIAKMSVDLNDKSSKCEAAALDRL